MTAQADSNPSDVLAWQRRATVQCRSNRDAKERLAAVLGIFGADEHDHEEEPGLPEQQRTAEALIRSVIRYLNA